MEMDTSQQKDEAMVLKEIYGEKLFEYDEKCSKGTIKNIIDLNGSSVRFGVQSVNEDDDKVCYSRKVDHVPPIMLEFEFPNDYPSTSRPKFSLRCIWLSSNQIKILEEHLIDLWKDSEGSEILFIWANFLQTDVLTFLDISNEFIVKKENISSLFKRSLNWIRELEEYDLARKCEIFNDTIFTCYICFQDKLGRDSVQFKGCDHVYCKVCMKSYFETKIQEGTEAGIVCPTDKCSVEALPTQIKELVSEKLYSDFENGLIEMSLRDMSDVVRCPLKHCRVPTIIDLKSNSGECPSCRFVFCSNCMATYHALNPCKIPLAKQRELVEQYRNLDEMGKEKMEKIYSKKFLREAENAILSYDLIKSTSTNCPNCFMAIEKAYGCNKMTCSRCSTNFCYTCGEKITHSDPYAHYSDPTSGCNNQLFDFIDDEFDEEFDDEFVEVDFPAIEEPQ